MVAFQPDLSLSAVLGLFFWGWRASGTAGMPVSAKETIKDGTTGRIVHILLRSLCEIDGTDAGGFTWTIFPPLLSFSSRLGPLFTALSASGCRWELWPASLPSTLVPLPSRFLSPLDPSFRFRLPLVSRFFNFLNGFDTESRRSMLVLYQRRIQMVVRWQMTGLMVMKARVTLPDILFRLPPLLPMGGIVVVTEPTLHFTENV